MKLFKYNPTTNSMFFTYLIACALAMMIGGLGCATPQSTQLAKAGVAVMPIVVNEDAADEVKAHAATLAEYLEKISGAKFEIKSGDGLSGIALGTATDFPALAFAQAYDTDDNTKREDYLLRSHENGVYLVGVTPLAVRHAVWDLLDRLGYRHFFPGKNWEVVPRTPDLKIEVDTQESPSFYGRRIWYGFGNWPDNRADKKLWDQRNRIASGLSINSGHAWDAIYSDKKAEFEAHPEYLVSQKPVKFCISNPGLRKLIAEWALEKFDKNPDLDSISLDPSDGDGWNNPDSACQDSEVYNSISDRLVTLANEVVAAVHAKYPGKYIGIYAYFKHSPPPSIKVNPHLAVGIATSFISGGYTFEQLAKGWSEKGATIGVREYYSVVVSHKDRPGGLGAGDPRRIARNIKNQHQLGARFMSAESSDSWGPGGLGYYLAARTLWNVNADTTALIEDFYDKAFGAAQKPMREFYDMIDRANKPLFSEDLVGRMYRKLKEARQMTTDSGIRGRIDDLVLYTRYVELLQDVSDQEAVGAILTHAYRIRNTHMVHSYALWRDTRGWPFRPDKESITHWKTPEGQNPWKGSTPFSKPDIEKILSEGIANNGLISFKPVAYSKDLVPAKALNLPPRKQGNYGYVRFDHHLYVWVEQAPATLKLAVTGGQISPKGRTSLALYAEDDPTSQKLSTAEVPNDRQPHEVTLKTTFAGLHRVEIRTRRNAAHVRWPEGMPVVFASAIDERITLAHRINMYFYVPKGTKVVGGFAQSVGGLVDGDGKRVFEFTKADFQKGNYFSVPVPAGQDGKLWKFVSSAGPRLLMTVPPYLFGNAEEMLLPREVVEADQ